MRNALSIISILLVLPFSAIWCQEISKSIDEICKEFKLIINDTALKTVQLINEEYLERMTDGGGQLSGYFKNGKILKIVSWVGLSFGNEIFEYYYKNNRLIFVYEEFHSFFYAKESGELRHDTTEKTFTGRYYFKDNKLIGYITTGHNRFEDDRMDPKQTLLSESEKNKLAILRKMKNIR